MSYISTQVIPRLDYTTGFRQVVCMHGVDRNADVNSATKHERKYANVDNGALMVLEE